MRKIWRPMGLACLVAAGLAFSTNSLRADSGPSVRVTAAVEKGVVRLDARADHPFEYTIYRPSDNLYVVDLSGVSAPKVGAVQVLSSGVVRSYRLVGYSSGTRSIARLEILLGDGAQAKVQELSKDEIAVVVSRRGENTAKASAAPHVVNTALKTAGSSAASAAPSSEIHQIQLQRDGDAIQVLVEGTGALDYHELRLSKPDRLVLDFAGTRMASAQHKIPSALAPVRDVRAAQFNPQTARVVIDLSTTAPYTVKKVDRGISIEFTASQPQQSASDVPAISRSASPAASDTQAAAAISNTPDVAAPAAPATPEGAQAPASVAPAPVAGSAPAPEATPSDAAASTAQPSMPAAATAQPVATQPADNSTPAVVSSPAPEVAASAPAPAPEATPSDAAASTAPTSVPAAATAQPVATQPADNSTPAVVSSPAPEVAASAPAPAAAPAPVKAQSAPVEAVSLPAPAASEPPSPAAAAATVQTAPGGDETKYTGAPISVNLKDVDLVDFFRLIHEISGLNVVVDPSVKGTLTLVLDNVPWDQALDIVLKNNDLDKQLNGNVLRIATKATLRKEAEENKDLAKAQAEAEPVVTTTRVLSYAKSDDMAKTLKQFLSPRGDILSDPRTNTLIIRDVPGVLPVLDNLIRELDRKSQQVEIEARVVAANRNFAREIGTEFAFATSTTSGRSIFGGNPGVGTSPLSRLSPPLPVPPLVVSSSSSTPPILSSLPLNTALGAAVPTSGISYSFSSPNFALDYLISAAETKGVGRLLSKPRVITQNNEIATVKQGVKVPIQTIINNTISVQYIDAVLELQVTPQITAEGTVFMNIHVENTQIDPSIPRVEGIPALDTEAADTKVLVNDGATIVVGGIIISQQQNNISQVPFFGSLPIIGNLFKHTSVSTQSQELLFFITPRILPT